MAGMNQVLDDKLKAGMDGRNISQPALLTHAIYSVDARSRTVVLQDPASGNLLQYPQLLPHQDIWRTPTPDQNYVTLLSMNGSAAGGIPILYDRSYIEPRIFETADPPSEQA